jgi:hypothetical protein
MSILFSPPFSSFILSFYFGMLSKLLRDVIDMFHEFREDPFLMLLDLNHDIQLIKDILDLPNELAFGIDVQMSLGHATSLDHIFCFINLRSLLCVMPEMFIRNGLLVSNVTNRICKKDP